eukprot:1609486-Pyramimonas_sp.AAC.1
MLARSAHIAATPDHLEDRPATVSMDENRVPPVPAARGGHNHAVPIDMPWRLCTAKGETLLQK